MNIIKDRLLVIGHSAITIYKFAEFYGFAANRERARAMAIKIGAKGQGFCGCSAPFIPGSAPSSSHGLSSSARPGSI
jgi:hypothetical protein